MNNSRSFLRTNLSTIVMCLMMLYATILPTAAISAKASVASVTNVLCLATNQLTGPVGRVVAVVVIASLAISLFLGKVSWGLAISTMVGMGILFGAQSVVNMLSGGSAASCGS